MQLSNPVSTIVRDCLFPTTGYISHLSPRCSLRDLLLDEEHGDFRHFCRSEFDVKEALFIQATEREMWSVEKGRGNGGGYLGGWEGLV